MVESMTARAAYTILLSLGTLLFLQLFIEHKINLVALESDLLILNTKHCHG